MRRTPRPKLQREQSHLPLSIQQQMRVEPAGFS